MPIVTSKLPAKLRNLKTRGLNCPCCRDTGSYMFGFERKDCERCDYADINNDILKRLPSTLNKLAKEMDWWLKDTLAEHIATMHDGGRVKFKNNGKDGVLIVRAKENK